MKNKKKNQKDLEYRRIFQAAYNKYAHLFPETRAEIRALENSPGFNDIQIPEELKNPDWLFKKRE